MVKADDILLMSVNKYLGKEGTGCAVLTSKLNSYPTMFSKQLISTEDDCYLTQLAGNNQKVFVLVAEPDFYDESLYYVNSASNQVIKINLNHLDELNESNIDINGNKLLISNLDDSSLWEFIIPIHISNKKEVIFKNGDILRLPQPGLCHNLCTPINSQMDKNGILWIIYKDKNKFNYLAKYDNNRLIGEYDIGNKLHQQFYRLYLTPDNKMFLLAKDKNEDSGKKISQLYQLNLDNNEVIIHRLIIWNEDEIEIPQILGIAFHQNTTYLVAGTGLSSAGDYIYKYNGFAPEKTAPISQFIIPGITDIAIASR
jgi:hypothetical protein